MNIIKTNFKNEFTFIKELEIKGLRYPKILEFNNFIYLFGSKLFKKEDNKNKYLINYNILDYNFNILSINNILDLSSIIENYFDHINLSSWLRRIYLEDNIIYMYIEIKYNIENIYFKHKNIIIKTYDLKNFNIINENDNNSFVFYKFNNIELSSLIINLENNFWGKYLFNFKINNKEIIPKFDKIVNYQNDYGHLIHNVTKIDNKWRMLFSIRHKIDGYINYSNNFSYIYKIYFTYTNDFINFYDTEEINLNYNLSEFFSYPDFFIINNKNYIITNQDDFGKNKNLLLFYQD